MAEIFRAFFSCYDDVDPSYTRIGTYYTLTRAEFAIMDHINKTFSNEQVKAMNLPPELVADASDLADWTVSKGKIEKGSVNFLEEVMSDEEFAEEIPDFTYNWDDDRYQYEIWVEKVE
jgi:hypothetical protein